VNRIDTVQTKENPRYRPGDRVRVIDPDHPHFRESGVVEQGDHYMRFGHGVDPEPWIVVELDRWGERCGVHVFGVRRL
jgi:hypothetical protein